MFAKGKGINNFLIFVLYSMFSITGFCMVCNGNVTDYFCWFFTGALRLLDF